MNETMRLDEVPRLVGRLYDIVDRLEELFPGRKFTPDGHLVGSIGEVIAANLYGWELLPPRARSFIGTPRLKRSKRVRVDAYVFVLDSSNMASNSSRETRTSCGSGRHG